MTDTLVLILGDQLSRDMSSLKAADQSSSVVLMCEVLEEATYVKHHKQKLVFIFSAMRHFAAELEDAGWKVDYVRLEDKANSGAFSGEVKRALKRHKPEKLIVTEAGEWRVQAMIDGWAEELEVEIECLPDNRFICSKDAFAHWASGRKQMRMEYFYREMRRKTGLLMDGDEPEGGQWNFDKENRKPLKEDLFLPTRKRFAPDALTQQVMELVEARFSDNFGTLSQFGWAVDRKGAEEALDDFINCAVAEFGDYQDAMVEGRPFLYHSLISAYINVGLLDPLSVCRRVEECFKDGKVPINAAEGFIRQIIGWREYVRGIYWLKMPDYVEANALDAKRDLPWFYWSGETDMACIRDAVCQTRDYAYAHHIQRLMITGTFALIAGIDPKALHEWYLSVYVDAFEWVELPNTLGMSQFADGGFLGSKPYAASGSYIDRMSNYCSGCRYDVKSRTGEDACPFNALYWDFMARNRHHLKSNGRLNRVYSNWDRMGDDQKQDLRKRAREFLDSLS
ncbi:cryptochrome/photolyase family protein [Rhizobium sp. L1K21]|uniref:cryptochrome/photolyase family protein n=1 Tax=Rhizobium sp. L1K21 TaxID=2954933 RepID=UPI00209382A5|nr:cryptochrome/photolyase family protein [Rhizobium sp. L1K21]MCO6185085.1 cryptochrome/photolyase family protein [Rhizobium sp. L1K21]